MNHNGKWMKPKATCLTEAQRCEIIAKLSRPNAPSKRAQGRDYEVSKGTIRKVWESWGERTATKSNLSRHLLNLKMLPNSKALKLYTTLSSTSTTNCFAPMFKHKLNKCMMNYDIRLRCFNDTLTNWQSMSSVQNSCILSKWLCMTHSNNKVWTLIYVQKTAHLTQDAYSNECVLKQEITVWHTNLITPT